MTNNGGALFLFAVIGGGLLGFGLFEGGEGFLLTLPLDLARVGGDGLGTFGGRVLADLERVRGLAGSNLPRDAGDLVLADESGLGGGLKGPCFI